MKQPAAALVAVALILTATSAARAHPVPNENHDRTIVVRLTPEAVLVDYRLEVDEARAARDMPDEELAGMRSREEFYTGFLRYFAPVLAENLTARLDGRELKFTCVRQRFAVLDHLRCDYRFRADWRLTPGGSHAFAFREGNYDMDDFSGLRLTLTASPRLTLESVRAPSVELMDRPADKRGRGDAERLRRVAAKVVATPGVLPGIAKPALPPDPEPMRRPPRKGQRVGAGKPAPPGRTGLVRTDPPPAETDNEDAAEDVVPSQASKLFHLLLNTRQGLGVLLLLAALFGAAHALTPGHGKTMVAAYLVGERGTVWHALLLGVVTTLTHTAAVLVLAGVLPLFFPNAAPATVQLVLGLVGGLLIAGLGAWLLMCRLAGQADHVHLGGHSHDHSHAHDYSNVRPGVWGLVVLGVSGGIVPCWDALAMLGFAISAQRLTLALPLLLAFSAGLAAVLVALGVGVVWARKAAGAWWGKGERFRWVTRALPLASAAIITAMGLWLCFDAIQTGTVLPK